MVGYGWSWLMVDDQGDITKQYCEYTYKITLSLKVEDVLIGSASKIPNQTSAIVLSRLPRFGT